MRVAAGLVPVLALVAAWPATADIRDLSATLPEAATWHDPLIASFAGKSNCFVELLGVDTAFEPGADSLLLVRVTEYCILDPPSFQPFSLQVDLGQVTPGHYTVRLLSDGVEVYSAPLAVYQAADLEIGLPAAPVTNLTPLVFTVSGVTSTCVEPDPATLAGQTIVVHFPLGCPLLPPGGGLRSFAYSAGTLPPGDYEIRAFLDDFALAKRSLRIHDASGCVPSPTVLCLGDDRFRVEATWMDFQGASGAARSVPLADRDDTGLFWFFAPSNIELTVKVLDGCGLNDRFWVFLASGSTVQYTLTVTDTDTGASWTSSHAAGTLPALIADTTALPSCP